MTRPPPGESRPHQGDPKTMFRISPRLLVPPLVLLAITATACSADD